MHVRTERVQQRLLGVAGARSRPQQIVHDRRQQQARILGAVPLVHHSHRPVAIGTRLRADDPPGRRRNSVGEPGHGGSARSPRLEHSLTRGANELDHHLLDRRVRMGVPHRRGRRWTVRVDAGLTEQLRRREPADVCGDLRGSAQTGRNGFIALLAVGHPPRRYRRLRSEPRIGALSARQPSLTCRAASHLLQRRAPCVGNPGCRAAGRRSTTRRRSNVRVRPGSCRPAS